MPPTPRHPTPPPAVLPLLLLLAACGGGSTGPEPPPPVAPVLVLGGRHACRAEAAHTTCWGRGVEGQLGRGGTPEVGAPAPVTGAPAFTSLAAGRAHTCGLTAEGAVWCWGAGGDGQLGPGTALPDTCDGQPCAPLPRLVAGLTDARQLAAGGTTTCVLDAEGRASCWGRNDLYQLGTAEAPDQCGFYACSHSPQVVEGGLRFQVISVSGNDHACGLTRSGAAWCWGFGRQGQLGNDALVDRSLPVAVHGGRSFRQLSAGGLHTCAVDHSERAWCWGIDALGAGGVPLESHVPVRVAGDVRWREVQSARFTSCGRATDGRAWCWGPNAHGEIGATPVGSTLRFDTPTAVSGGHRFTNIAPGSFTWCGEDADGRTWCWGDGRSGELGDPVLALSTTPVHVAMPE